MTLDRMSEDTVKGHFLFSFVLSVTDTDGKSKDSDRQREHNKL